MALAESPLQATCSGGNEAVLLVSCARTLLGLEQHETIRDLTKKDLDWKRVRRLAKNHRVELLLLRGLQEAGCEPNGCEPNGTELLQELSAYSRDIAVRNTLLVNELSRQCALFHGQGVQAIAYKGPVTAQLAYGHIALREFQDLDLLVRANDLDAVCNLLESQGYRTRRSLTAREKRHAQHELKEYCYRSGPILIEPHWRITARRFEVHFDYDAMWRRAMPLDLGFGDVLVLAPEDRVLVQAVTAGKSKWTRLGLICDMAGTLSSQPDLDWCALLERARRQGCMKLLLLALALSSDVLGSKIPPSVLDQVRDDSSICRLSRKIQARLFDETEETGYLRDFPWRFSPLLLKLRDTPRDRLVYTWRTLTTPTLSHLRRCPLPHWLMPIYRVIVPVDDYLLRPIGRLAAEKLSRR